MLKESLPRKSITELGVELGVLLPKEYEVVAASGPLDADQMSISFRKKGQQLDYPYLRVIYLPSSFHVYRLYHYEYGLAGVRILAPTPSQLVKEWEEMVTLLEFSKQTISDYLPEGYELEGIELDDDFLHLYYSSLQFLVDRKGPQQFAYLNSSIGPLTGTSIPDVINKWKQYAGTYN